jgi:hypothetical protein
MIHSSRLFIAFATTYRISGIEAGTGLVADWYHVLLFYPDRPLWNYVRTFAPGILHSLYRPCDPCLHGGRLFFRPGPGNPCIPAGFARGWKYDNDQEFCV